MEHIRPSLGQGPCFWGTNSQRRGEHSSLVILMEDAG